LFGEHYESSIAPLVIYLAFYNFFLRAAMSIIPKPNSAPVGGRWTAEVGGAAPVYAALR